VTSDEHLAGLRAEEQLLETMLSDRDRVRATAMAAIGHGDHEAVRPFARVIDPTGRGMRPLVRLALLGLVSALPVYAATVLGPEIAGALGVTVGSVALARTVGEVAFVAAPLAAAAAVGRRPRRARLALAAGIVTGVATAAAAVVTNLLGLFAVFVIVGLATGAATAVHEPLLFDFHPPGARVRAMSAYRAAVAGGLVVGTVVTAVVVVAGFTWRTVFLVVGASAVIAAALAFGLSDPGYGRWDTARIRAAVRRGGNVSADNAVIAEGRGAADGDAAGTGLRFLETVRRVSTLESVRRLGGPLFVIGMLGTPVLTYTSFFLESRWHLGSGGRGAFFAVVFAVGAIGAAVSGRPGERLLASSPSRLVVLAAGLVGTATVLLAVGALVPVFAVTAVCMALAEAAVAAVFPTLLSALLSTAPAADRHVLAGILAADIGLGGVTGLQFLSGVAGHFGLAGALAALVVPGIAAALVLRAAAGSVDGDVARMVDGIIEDEEIAAVRRSGGRLPMLACKGIQFSYGPLQVLFDVDFTVDDGEIVALLGTNGAGKSTLLKVVSGIGIPSAGTVRLRGEDITYLDAERRVSLGITQVPGGRAVFGPMTVVENLRLYAYTLGRDRKAVERAIDTSFEVFPRLFERRTSNAATLSGGEQQMLGLAKALILSPQLLLIDELSLGLAPVIVGQLLEIVRRINAGGTAVVLVEQSVNIALSVVDHAYFMEKGEVRFDGASEDLLARGDLLRAVFLEGATKGTAG
jgi:ABC-type branched-subunit amino acid transport system ATPase component